MLPPLGHSSTGITLCMEDLQPGLPGRSVILAETLHSFKMAIFLYGLWALMSSCGQQAVKWGLKIAAQADCPQKG